MQKGFSITVSPNNIEVNSFISTDYDNYNYQSDSFDLLFEGVLLNKQKLLNEFAASGFEDLFCKLYNRKKEQLISLLEGEFRGFIFNKELQKLYVFTNITSTQRVFSGRFENSVYIDTSLIRLNNRLKAKGIMTQPNVEALYQILCFNNLLEHKTPIENIEKLLDGHYLEIDLVTCTYNEKVYFNAAEISVFTGSKNSALDQMDLVFSEAVKMEYGKDTELNTQHLALLSGGLDSRVALLYALKTGFKPDTALCFSQSRYYDHSISAKIAKDFQLNYEFIPLDGGVFLKKIDHLTEVSEGMVAYTGGIHVQHAVEKIQFENFALFHSGQIGDGVLGGFNTAAHRKAPGYFKIVDSPQFFQKVKTGLDQTLKNYETEELFLLRNIAYNRTVLGAHVFQQHRYQTSPFMSKDFIVLALSLPEEWKFNHRFYIEWINKHCPEATRYQWERTLLKPTASWKTGFGDNVMKRGFRIFNEKLLRSPQRTSMYPYHFYFQQDITLQQCYQQYYDQNIHRVEMYPELLKDVEILYKAENFFLKAKAINMLSIFKLYF